MAKMEINQMINEVSKEVEHWYADGKPEWARDVGDRAMFALIEQGYSREAMTLGSTLVWARQTAPKMVDPWPYQVGSRISLVASWWRARRDRRRAAQSDPEG